MTAAAEHLTQLPEDVRAVLQRLECQFHEEDRRLEQAILATVRQSRLAARVPALCETLAERCPAMSRRSIFRAVALFTGLHERHVARLFYESPSAAGEGR
jgi:hypothetical protein